MIVQASSDHYADIVRIYNQAVVTGSQTADTKIVSLEDKLPWLSQHSGTQYIIYVANIDDEVAGYLALSPYRYGRAAFECTAEISFSLDTNHQGKGVGTGLIAHAIDRSSGLEIESLVAMLLSCNLESIAILE